MERLAPTGAHRRGFGRWGRWLCITILLLPLVALGLSNLLLATPWVRDRIAGEIRKRTTLDAYIGGASWSPWGGMTLRSLRIEQPAALRPMVEEPLISISRIEIHPVWTALLRGKLKPREIVLQSPKIVLPLELIAHLAPPPPPSPQPPAVAMKTEPASPPVIIPSAPAPAAPPVAVRPATPPPSPPPVAPAPPAPAPAPVTATHPTRYLRVKDASFSLVLASARQPILGTSAISGSLPFSGGPADSVISIGSISLLGQPAVSAFRLPLEWRSPVLRSQKTQIAIGGLKSEILAGIGLGGALPFDIQIATPAQPLPSFSLPFGSTLSAESAAFFHGIQGFLPHPASWEARSTADLANLVLRSGERATRFDQGRMFNTLRQGTLSCQDARLTGDEVSFLGNGTVLANGRLAAVLRIIAPPETTLSLIRQIFPGLSAPPAFTALSTPQRAALDLEASGGLGDIRLRLGKNGPSAALPTP